MVTIDIASIINLILLVLIFNYQKNKNKLMLQKIKDQEALLSETKNIVTTQSVAIEGQGRVVETALKYSESFSLEKIEGIIKRELMAEWADEKRSIEERHKAERERLKGVSDKLGTKGLEAVELAKKLSSDLVKPTMKALIVALCKMPLKQRDEVIHNMEENSAKEMVMAILEDVYKEAIKVGEDPNDALLK